MKGPDHTGRPGRIWLAWERQRRSLELAARLGARLELCLHEDRGRLRYPLSIARTLRILGTCRGKTVFAQNPSMLLAALAGLLKRVFGYRLVVDRHSNFTFLSGTPPGPKRLLLDFLSGLTLRLADLTLVTNPGLAARVERLGGRPFVLPDPFPEVPPSALAAARARGPRNPGAPLEVLFVSSWAFDEPIAAALEACRSLPGRVNVRVTGRPKAAFAGLLEGRPGNFIPTGFLSDADYFDLMARCDAVMCVTSRDCTLVCGAYEAVAMGKPMILGDTPTLRDWFDAGALHTDGSAEDLRRVLVGLERELPSLEEGVRGLLARRGPEWQGRLASLRWLLGELGEPEELVKAVKAVKTVKTVKPGNRKAPAPAWVQSGIGS